MKTIDKIFLKDYAPPPFFIDQADLLLEINDDHTFVTSKLKIRKNSKIANQGTPLVLNKGEYTIISVIAGGMILLPGEYEDDDEFFKLARTPDEFDLEITNILKPQDNTSLEGLYKSGDILCTQCEAQGFRKITPFLDRPDVMTVFSCTIIADKKKYPVLLSNGNLVKSGKIDNARHYVRWEDHFKKPGYLFAIVAGDLNNLKDEFTTSSRRKVALKIYSKKENIDKCHHAMKSLKQAMKWDEQRFGLEYDLDLYQIVAIDDFNAGAMENKGLNIFNSKYVLADQKTATDEDFINIQTVIGHEYFHNWTGNRVTLKNWFQLSLKEGLTVFRDQEFSSDLNSRGVKRVLTVSNLRSHQFPEDEGPMAHPVMPDSYIKMDNFYTMTVYEKGSELIRMIHQLLGEKTFQKGLSLYFQKFDGMAVTIEDFMGVMQQASGVNLEQFKLWYSQSGTPKIKMTHSHDKKRERLNITFEQSTPPDKNQDIKKPFHIPINFGIMDARGRDLIKNITSKTQKKESTLLELKKEKETFTFNNIPENALPSIFRQFSAPVKIETDLTDIELAFLMANDTDEFCRWDAAQSLFTKEIKQIVNCIQKNKKLSVSSILINAVKKAMMAKDIDHAFLSKTLSLPIESEIKNHFAVIDVSAIHRARLFLKKQIAQQLETKFYDIIDLCSGSDALSLSHDAMADRSLKNMALSYLGCLRKNQTTDLVLNYFNGAQNMTDELAAFKILANINQDIKSMAVEKFYLKWKTDKLVLDKWFAVQAGSTLPGTLDLVKSLTCHRAFSMKNPNKVRSLIYMFAMQNPINFHQNSGAGYTFIADQIMTLDSINPQVAARLASCFNHWKKYEPQNQKHMKNKLEQILNVTDLSKNVYEIVSRALV
jgi:aminopeptidase N